MIEETYDFLYKYLLKSLKSPKNKNEFRVIKENILDNIETQVHIIQKDCELYSMPITRELMHDKTIYLIKKMIDCLCLIHNEMEFKIITPHPIFQNKGYSGKMINIELKLLSNIECINMLTRWEKRPG